MKNCYSCKLYILLYSVALNYDSLHFSLLQCLLFYYQLFYLRVISLANHGSDIFLAQLFYIIVNSLFMSLFRRELAKYELINEVRLSERSYLY